MRKKTAHWIRHTHLFRKDEFECSVCGFMADKPYKTCPHCGEQLKGSKYDPFWIDEIELLKAATED